MPSRTIRQPNGLLAVFSSVVDNITAYDMNRDEAIAYYTEGHHDMGRLAAEAKVQRGIDDEPVAGWLKASGRNDGLDRFRDAMKDIELVHGKDEAERWRVTLSIKPTPAAP